MKETLKEAKNIASNENISLTDALLLLQIKELKLISKDTYDLLKK